MARPAVCLIAVATALALGGCGSDDTSSAPAQGSQPSATATPAATKDRSYGY
jgi:uncharacterized protein YceK